MASWNEIRALAADLKRTQLSSTVLRLSERNCVEIVQRLGELNLLSVIYTLDGKEYLTPLELTKEIKEELFASGGRVNLVDLQTALNVDLSHIEAKANEVARNNKQISLVLGQLITNDYMNHVAEEINDKLQEQGQVTLAEVTTSYGLPAEFLANALDKRMGSIIHGQKDESDKNVIFTQAFVNRHKAQVKGAFSALTRPVNVAAIMNQLHLQERLFFLVLEELVHSGRLAGSISGGRQDQAQYIPDIYVRSQNEWVNNFYKQNGYLEYDAVARLGVTDVKNFIKKRLRGESLLYLSSCCVGAVIRERLQAHIDEALATVGWIDVTLLLPSVFTGEDSSQLIQKLTDKKSDVAVYCDCIVASHDFIHKCRAPFDDVMRKKAKTDAVKNPSVFASKAASKSASHDDGRGDDRRDQRRQKGGASGKSGGGTQGRETKTKKTKNKYKGRGNDDISDDEMGGGGGGAATSGGGRAHEIEFLSVAEIAAHLKQFEALEECEEQFIDEIAAQLHRPLTRQYQDIAKSVFLETIGGATTSSRKKTHGELAEKVNGLWTNVKLFEKGLKLFPEDTQPHFSKHLLKTVCTDLVNLVFNTIAADHMMSLNDESQITADMRLKILGKLPESKTKVVLAKLNSSLSAKSLDEFLMSFESACDENIMGIMLKKLDKKKEKQLVFGHKQCLLDQLRSETDAAMTLHLASTVLFNVFTQCMIQAPGRCVPYVITLLNAHLEAEKFSVLVQCQDLVVKEMRLQSEKTADVTELTELRQQLAGLVQQVKDIAMTTKRSSSAQQQPET